MPELPWILAGIPVVLAVWGLVVHFGDAWRDYPKADG